ncbi:hypothetical protein [Flavobacterium fluviatile]|uniref:hypothetical protein n=1 Tax=Flavobacterium fluviatile TaxID=1862387 RepID=UPI0013D526FC|nr:hypothetical protein [Flavobacterium fluviatile]
MTQLVIQHYLDKYQTMANTMTDIDFSNLSFLTEKEPIYNMAGQKVSKSYFDKKGREAVRICYNRIYGNYIYNDVVYPNVFLGFSKTVCYLDWSGEIVNRKSLQPYEFNLEPVFLGDGTETVVGFSSQKQREILKTERFKADDYLAGKNPQLYAFLYAKYGNVYNTYLRTGIKNDLVDALNNEVDTEILAVLNNEVFGYEPMTVKELIIMNLQ